MFGRKQAKIDGLKMAFYTDAAAEGHHGKILVSSRRRGLDHVVVYFVFVGMVAPPALTPSLMEHIWTEAKAQGFVPFEIVGALEVNEAPKTAPAGVDPTRTLHELDSIGAALDHARSQGYEARPKQPMAELSTLGNEPLRTYDPGIVANAKIPAWLRKERDIESVQTGGYATAVAQG